MLRIVQARTKSPAPLSPPVVRNVSMSARSETRRPSTSCAKILSSGLNSFLTMRPISGLGSFWPSAVAVVADVEAPAAVPDAGVPAVGDGAGAPGAVADAGAAAVATRAGAPVAG